MYFKIDKQSAIQDEFISRHNNEDVRRRFSCMSEAEMFYSYISTDFTFGVQKVNEWYHPVYKHKYTEQLLGYCKKVQVGKDQKKIPTPKTEVGKNQTNNQVLYTMKHIVSRMSSYFPNRWPLSYLNLTKIMKTYIRRQQHKKL